MKRSKKLKKGIESIGEQIAIHKIKHQQAIEEKKIELASYYEKEIKKFEDNKTKKEDQLDR